jgi:predicted PurR-regulated permease PerM
MHELKMDASEGGGAFRIRTFATVVLAVGAAIYVLRLAGPVLVPVLVALLFAYALEPVVSRLVRWRVPRPVAAAVAFVLVAVLVGEVGRSVADEVSSFLDGLPAALADVHLRAPGGDEHPGPLSRVQQAAATLTAPTTSATDSGAKRITIVPGAFDVRAYLLGATRGILNSAVQAFAVALLTFLLLATGDLYKRKLVRVAGPDWISKRITLDVIRLIDQQIERYLVARLLISALVALGTAVPLWLIGVARPIMWGLVAGALNVIPFIGPAAAVGLVAAAAFLQFRTIEPVLAAGGAATMVAALEGNVITPWIMGRAGELNTVAVFVSVLFWGWMWDVWGLLLAVPITVVVKAAADRIEPLEPLGELLGR